ncbi:MAG: protein tyrosine phosphatase family protein, partial [Vicinamibacterales bacterium]
MTTARIEDARNFRRVDETLLTSGQPDEAQLTAASQAGVEVVINLALHDDPRYSLADERGTVEGLGMTYRHIPVQFGDPSESDLLAFFDAMEEAQGRHVLVHCAANYRVTAFLGLYRRLRHGWPVDRAFELMRTVWAPDPVWAGFI